MDHNEIYDLLKTTFGPERILENCKTGDEKKGYRDSFILIAKDALPEVCQFLRNDERLRFNLLHCISGVEWPEYFESVYHLFSLPCKHRVTLKVRVEKAEPRVPSVTGLWPAANWLERETYDMVGIVYDGHPSLTRILLPEEWEGHPLRKEYEMPDHEHLREIGF